MYCRNCGKELPDEAQFCSNCGQETGFVAGDPNLRQDSSPTYWSSQRYPAAGAAKALGIIGIIILIASLFFFSWFGGAIYFLIITMIFGALAVIFSVVYKVKHKELLQGPANTGLVLGIINVVLGFIYYSMYS